jgi:hypothetical protein
MASELNQTLTASRALRVRDALRFRHSPDVRVCSRNPFMQSDSFNR